MNDNEKNTNLAYSMSILYEDDGSERTWTIYGIPRTKKNSPMIAGTGRKCPVCGKPAQQWVRQGDVYTKYAALALMQLEPKPTKPIGYPVNVRCVFYLNTRRRIDKSNLEAAAHDLLVEAGILADDNRDIIATTDGSCVLYDREKPRTEITITPLKAMGSKEKRNTVEEAMQRTMDMMSAGECDEEPSFWTKPFVRNAIGVVLLISVALIFFFVGRDKGYNNGYDDAYDWGVAVGRNTGYDKGYDKGYDNGVVVGRHNGYDEGYSAYEKTAIENLKIAESAVDALIRDAVSFFRRASWYSQHACVVTTSGSRYHHYDCYHIKNRSFYIYNIETAKALGYTKCLDCWDAGIMSDVYLPTIQVLRWYEVREQLKIN